MNCKYGLYIDIKTPNGSLLRAGDIFAHTLKTMLSNAGNCLWLLGVPSSNHIKITDIEDWHNYDNAKLSDKFSLHAMDGNTVVIYYKVMKGK